MAERRQQPCAPVRLTRTEVYATVYHDVRVSARQGPHETENDNTTCQHIG